MASISHVVACDVEVGSEYWGLILTLQLAFSSSPSGRATLCVDAASLGVMEPPATYHALALTALSVGRKSRLAVKRFLAALACHERFLLAAIS